MKYTTLSKKSDSYFQRKTGVKKPTFGKMVDIVKKSIANRKTKRGNEATFQVEDQLLIMLQYYREYPTFFSLGDSVTSIKTRSSAVKFCRPVFPGREKVPSAIRISSIRLTVLCAVDSCIPHISPSEKKVGYSL